MLKKLRKQLTWRRGEGVVETSAKGYREFREIHSKKALKKRADKRNFSFLHYEHEYSSLPVELVVCVPHWECFCRAADTFDDKSSQISYHYNINKYVKVITECRTRLSSLGNIKFVIIIEQWKMCFSPLWSFILWLWVSEKKIAKEILREFRVPAVNQSIIV